MASGSWEHTRDGIRVHLQSLFSRRGQMAGYLERVAYPQYQKAQIDRWQTENASETGKWNALSPTYAKTKRRHYGGGVRYKWVGGKSPWAENGTWPSFPGGGNVIMIATGKLSQAAMGRGPGALKAITNTSMRVGVQVSAIPYAPYAAAVRDIVAFGDATVEKIAGGAMRWFMSGEGAE